MNLILKVLLGIWLYLIVGFAVYVFFMFISVKNPNKWFTIYECYDGGDALILIIFWSALIPAYLVCVIVHLMDHFNNFLRERMGK